MAFIVMTALGACGGFFIVPLNALLQARGHHTVGAGHAVAVQNLAENAAMLLMIGVYMLALRAHAPITAIAAGSVRHYRCRSRQPFSVMERIASRSGSKPSPGPAGIAILPSFASGMSR
jgi:hypothetical protein